MKVSYFQYLHSTMYLFKPSPDKYAYVDSVGIYIPLCIYLNRDPDVRYSQTAKFTFHYVSI